MRFNKILHPEILMGKRGDSFLRKFYEKTAHDIDLRDDGRGGMGINALVMQLDRSQQRSLALMQRWRKDQGGVYHVNRDFLEALARVERGISMKYLPERFVGYISFADGAVFDESDEIEGAYVFIGPAKYTMLKDVSSQRVFWCAYLTKDYKAVGTTICDIVDGETLDDLMRRVGQDDNPKYRIGAEDFSQRARVFNTVLNCCMYIHSSEPDVRRVLSSEKLTNKKISEIKTRTGIRNDCTLPVTFLNWNYARQRQYTVDSTWIDTFMRWQPCGPGLSQIKLIWVAAHERHYKAGV